MALDKGKEAEEQAVKVACPLFFCKIFSITLGSGKRLFTEGTIPMAFKLKNSKMSPKGVIIANYECAGVVQTGSLPTQS